MPIKFLKASCKGFFIDKDGYALGIRDELADVIKVDAFKKQMKDIIEYRTMEYYRRRYVENWFLILFPEELSYDVHSKTNR